VKREREMREAGRGVVFGAVMQEGPASDEEISLSAGTKFEAGSGMAASISGIGMKRIRHAAS